MAAYALQDGGLDTVDANRHLGFKDDLRSYEAVEHILADIGVKVRGVGCAGALQARGKYFASPCASSVQITQW